jgi:hypothetical protein
MSTLRMKTINSHVAELTCRWGKPCSWAIKPKIVAAAPINVEAASTTDLRLIRKAHHTAALRAVLSPA